jgi:hypothetical protein
MSNFIAERISIGRALAHETVANLEQGDFLPDPVLNLGFIANLGYHYQIDRAVAQGALVEVDVAPGTLVPTFPGESDVQAIGKTWFKRA